MVRAWATPTINPNCGNAQFDSLASDTAFRINFDNSTNTNQCQVNFASPEDSGWQTFCFVSNPEDVSTYSKVDDKTTPQTIQRNRQGTTDIVFEVPQYYDIRHYKKDFKRSC